MTLLQQVWDERSAKLTTTAGYRDSHDSFHSQLQN
jgi:hypothetical protein